MRYSVAIRTLGTAVGTLRRELISLHNQSIPPEKIIIYIAKGYKRPDFQIGIEEYVYVDKGMMAQRTLRYNEIESDYILMLDDDVELAPDSVEILLKELVENKADCIAADTFVNHEMSVISKLKALIGIWVFPHFDQKWAFKLHSTGSFSYINNPKSGVYASQSAAGPASLWKKSVFLEMNYQDELWLDKMGYAFGEDELTYYKLYINNKRLFVSFDCGIVNLDNKSASSVFQKDKKKFYIRSATNYIRWYRMLYQTQSNGMIRNFRALSYGLKILWLFFIHLLISLYERDLEIVKMYWKGIKEGRKFILSDEYKAIPSYKFK